ncbi:MAG: hypothetical protein ABIR06_03670 [Cyclobacteriaceae bacterium]
MKAAIFFDFANHFTACSGYIAMTGNHADNLSSYVTYFSILNGTKRFTIIIYNSTVSLELWMPASVFGR